MKGVFFLLLVLTIGLKTYGQQMTLDSLDKELLKESNDSLRIKIVDEQLKICETKDNLIYSQKIIEIAEKNIVKQLNTAYFMKYKAVGLNGLGYYYDFINDNNESLKSYSESIAILSDLKDSLSVYIPIVNLFNCYKKLGMKKEAILNAYKVLEISKSIYTNNINFYIQDIYHIANYLDSIGERNEAMDLYKEGIELSRILYYSKTEYYKAGAKNAFALYYKIAEQNMEVIYRIKESQIIDSVLFYLNEIYIDSKNTYEYGSQLNPVAFLYSESGFYNKALQLYDEGLKTIEKTKGKEDKMYAILLTNKAQMYSKQGNFKGAQELYSEALFIRKKVLGENSPKYLRALWNVFLIESKNELSEFSDQIIIEILRLSEVIYGDTSKEYIDAVDSYGYFLHEMGRRDEAAKQWDKEMSICKILYGSNSIEYAKSLYNIGFGCINEGSYEEAISLCENALFIADSIGGYVNLSWKFKLALAEAYRGLGGYLNAATKLYLELLKDSINYHAHYFTVTNNIATLYKDSKEYKYAIKSLKDALNYNYNSTSKQEQNHIRGLLHLCELYIITDSIYKAEKLIIEAISLSNNNLNDQFAYLSEKERMLYKEKHNMRLQFLYEFGMKRKLTNPEITKVVFDNLIKFKGILSENLLKMKNAVMQSKDQELTGLFYDWEKLKHQLEKIYISASKNNVLYYEQIADSVNLLERELNRRTKGYNISDVSSWKEIQNKIEQNEVALEFLNIQHSEYDSITYCALIIKKDSKYPEMIPLFGENQIIPLLTSVAAERGIELLKEKDNVNFGRDLYQLIWKPLEGYLQGINKIYYSPSGLLNKVSFASLEDTSGTMLIDRFELHQLQSTADIEEIKENKFNLPNSIALFGGANYNLSADSMHVQAIGLSKPADIQLTAKRTLPSSTNTNWTYLPGTLTEVNAIKKTFTNSKLVQTYSSNTATEDQLKALSGFSSPKIIHIATHGYYIPELKRKEKMDFILIRNESQFTSSINPLLRTGLILAGANNKWVNNIEIDGADDGILTALEISNLNFMNTDLVVLSACETGLGDIKGSEGVYGLQRAFRLAGVKRMIVSLWQVPDNETAEMMEYFYKSLMNEKKGYYAAFRAAQNKMKQKYPFAPIKWAGFVLIGE